MGIESPHISRKTVKDYTILNLNTKTIDENADCDELLPYCSVILDTATDTMLSLAPPLPLNIDKFMEKYPTFSEDIQAVPMFEGTMIQLFYNAIPNEWEIATKGNIGGNNWHYRMEYDGCSLQPQKTFRQMFYDAITNCKLVGTTDEFLYVDDGFASICYNELPPSYDEPLSANPFIQQLDKSYCYSFILKHPSNPIVHTVFLPSITLISAYKIGEKTSSGDYSVEIVQQSLLEQFIPMKFNRIVNVQKVLDHEHFNDLPISFMIGTRIQIHMVHEPGLMFINTVTGERAIVENPNYVYRRELRGNHQNLQYQYFELIRNGKLAEFTRCFPAFIRLFQHFQVQYMDFVCLIHAKYVQHYIHHERVEPNYHKHIASIHHDIYKPSISRGERIVITLNVVLWYFDQMTPSQLLYILNNRCA